MNYLLLGVFTIALSFAVGLTSAYTKGKSIFRSFHIFLKFISFSFAKCYCLTSLTMFNISSSNKN